MFRFDKHERDGVTVLVLHGSLDALTAAGLKAEVVAIADAKTMKVVVDLEPLSLIDSTGVGVLISLFKRVRALEGQVFFSGLRAQPKEVFRLLRLDRSLDLHPTASEAVDKIRKS
ncbi:MAG TPA: STAS domain-containing protein [Polyangia bacterium]|nr:STAS domain-containing protein [Polyangia bacterium]